MLGAAHAQEGVSGAGGSDLFGAQLDLEQDASAWSKVRLSGYLKNETAYRVREPRSITKIRNIAYVNAQYPYSDTVSLTYSGWAYYDLVYDLFNYETVAARLERNQNEPLAFVKNLAHEKDSPMVATRELYVDVTRGSWDMRAGMQYVVWGVLEGVRVVDEINPVDFRELILPDLLDYRVPLWTFKLDHYADAGNFELLLIPDLRFHKPAPPGSEWELLQDVPGTVEPASWKPENTELGLRWSTTWRDTELALSYFYTWDDFPVIFRTVKLDGTIPPVFFPTYTRISMYGLTAVRQMGSYILKGEFAYVTDKFFGRSNVADVDGDGYVDTNGEAQKNHIRWGAGVDFMMMSWDVSLGMTQWLVLGWEPTLIQKRTDTSYNLFMRREFPRYSMTAQLLVIYLQGLNERYIKPKVFFQVTNRFQVAVGMDMFDGRGSDFGTSSVTASGQFNNTIQVAQFLGNFHDNDRVFVEFKYSF